jgi:ABC-type uncharacterized transport system permease subunit
MSDRAGTAGGFDIDQIIAKLLEVMRSINVVCACVFACMRYACMRAIVCIMFNMYYCVLCRCVVSAPARRSTSPNWKFATSASNHARFSYRSPFSSNWSDSSSSALALSPSLPHPHPALCCAQYVWLCYLCFALFAVVFCMIRRRPLR